MPTEQLGSLLEQWIVDTRDSFKTLPDSPWSATFANKYGQVLTSASDQLERVLSEFNAFIRDLESGQITDQADALFRYIVAMSVAVEEEPVFLPSFSDKCLEILVQDRPFGGLSPFRGIYYAWQLGNIAKGLQSNKRNRYQRVVPGHDEWRSAFDRLETLRKELENDVQLQRDPSYPAYYDSLTATDKGVPIIEASLVRQIEHVKSAIKFGVQRKRRWLGLLPYQCQHSTHFYLSGIRFYWSPVLEERNEPMWTGREHPMDRFCVNSTDSGLVLPSERYGMILPDGGSDVCIEELAELVPVGSLFLDLSDMSATSEDAVEPAVLRELEQADHELCVFGRFRNIGRAPVVDPSICFSQESFRAGSSHLSRRRS